MKFSSDLGYLLNWTTVSQAVWCFFIIEDVSELNSESRRWRNYTAGDVVAVVSFISQVNQLSWLFWRNLMMSQLTPRDARDVFSCLCALWSRLKVVVCFCFCFAFSNTRLDSSLLEKKNVGKVVTLFRRGGRTSSRKESVDFGGGCCGPPGSVRFVLLGRRSILSRSLRPLLCSRQVSKTKNKKFI